jgi:serine/arginine repetitive matrix protein 1
VDPREIQLNIDGFLEDKTPLFMEELWKLLVSANSNPFGIPQEFLDKEREILEKESKVQEKIRNEIQNKSRNESPEQGRRRRSKSSSPERRRRRRSYSPDYERRRRKRYSSSPEHTHREDYRRRK